MSTSDAAAGPLTETQRQLVQDNIGLVAVHIRRHLTNLAKPRRDREWDDLFQEGCLGLIQAALRYREDRGIPFAAFALPRIHNAVSRALQAKFSTVRVPADRDSRARAAIRDKHNDDRESRPGAATRDRHDADGHSGPRAPAHEQRHTDGDWGRRAATRDQRAMGGDRPKHAVRREQRHTDSDSRKHAPERATVDDEIVAKVRDTAPRVYNMSDDMAGQLADSRERRRADPTWETAGDRLRRRYERAVHLAGEALSDVASARGDRRALVRLLIEERYLVPQEEERRALRQIARDTRSSFARVAQCDKQLAEAVRVYLEADPEFRVLRRRVRHDPIGPDMAVDAVVEGELRGAAVDALVTRFRHAGDAERARLLHRILGMAGADVDETVRWACGRLSPGQHDDLLTATAALDRVDAPHKEADQRHDPDKPRSGAGR